MAVKRAPPDVRREEILRAAFEVAGDAGIESLTLRSVAAEAQLSHALVLFHFKRKDRLVEDLLEWLLVTTPKSSLEEETGRDESPLDRLQAFVARETERLSREPRRVRLFVEYWALGTRNATIGGLVARELAGYRAILRTLVDEVLGAGPDTVRGRAADGIAALVLGTIYGYALQAMGDPRNFDAAGYLVAAGALMRQLVSDGGRTESKVGYDVKANQSK